VRDHLMTRLAGRYAGFGWQTNRGYCTEDHLTALALHGPTPHHRRSFSPVAQLRLV
jgi:ribonuclease HII